LQVQTSTLRSPWLEAYFVFLPENLRRGQERRDRQEDDREKKLFVFHVKLLFILSGSPILVEDDRR